MRKATAKYSYRIRDAYGKDVIVIMPAGNGRTLTNDIENVVAEIIEKEQIDIRDYLVLYEDTEGRWDGWDHINQTFIPLGSFGWKSSVLIYVTRQQSTAN